MEPKSKPPDLPPSYLNAERYPGSLVVAHIKEVVMERLRRRKSTPRPAMISKFEQFIIAWEGVAIIGVVALAFAKFSADAYLHERAAEFERRRELLSQYELECHNSMTHIKQMQGSLAFWGELHTRSEERAVRWNLQHQVNQLRQQLQEQQQQQQQQQQPSYAKLAAHADVIENHPHPGTQGWWARVKGGVGRLIHRHSNSKGVRDKDKSTIRPTDMGSSSNNSDGGGDTSVSVSCEAGVMTGQAHRGDDGGEKSDDGRGKRDDGSGDVSQSGVNGVLLTSSGGTGALASGQEPVELGTNGAHGEQQRLALGVEQVPSLHASTQQIKVTEHDMHQEMQHGHNHANVLGNDGCNPQSHGVVIELDGDMTGQGQGHVLIDAGHEGGHEPHHALHPVHPVHHPHDWQEVRGRTGLTGMEEAVGAAMHSADTAEHWEGWAVRCDEKVKTLAALYDAELHHLFESEVKYDQWKRYMGRELVLETGWEISLPTPLVSMLFPPQPVAAQSSQHLQGEDSLVVSSGGSCDVQQVDASHTTGGSTDDDAGSVNEHSGSVSSSVLVQQDVREGAGVGTDACGRGAGAGLDDSKAVGVVGGPGVGGGGGGGGGGGDGVHTVRSDGVSSWRGVVIRVRVWQPLWEAGDAEEQLADAQSTWDAVWGAVWEPDKVE